MKSLVQNLALACFSLLCTSAFAEPPTPPFYDAVMKMSPAFVRGRPSGTPRSLSALRWPPYGRTLLPSSQRRFSRIYPIMIVV